MFPIIINKIENPAYLFTENTQSMSTSKECEW